MEGALATELGIRRPETEDRQNDQPENLDSAGFRSPVERVAKLTGGTTEQGSKLEMPAPFEYIGFDADDTLWHNLTLFNRTEERFTRLLSRYHTREWISQRLMATEAHNLEVFGYGVKGFTLSMIETAIELTEGRVQGHEIQQIIEFSKEMLSEPVELLEHAEEAVTRLSRSHRLMLVTKGDLFDQETKLARSGLADFFDAVEIVTEKDADTYQRILQKHRIDPQRFLMVGNSLKSDVFPVLALGGQAVHVPYHSTWEHETVSQPPPNGSDYVELKHLGKLRRWLRNSGQSGFRAKIGMRRSDPLVSAVPNNGLPN